MEMFVGSKLINAKPMTRQEYHDFRGWTLPEDENGDDAGYLVEYVDGGKPNTASYYGYVSWSPKDVFERAYRSSGNLTFGDAVELMRMGKSMTRLGWNGRRKDSKPMYVNIVMELDNINKPFFTMVHADDSLGVWVPVVNDVLANDWAIV